MAAGEGRHQNRRGGEDPSAEHQRERRARRHSDVGAARTGRQMLKIGSVVALSGRTGESAKISDSADP
jgi:hypothetical protein